MKRITLIVICGAAVACSALFSGETNKEPSLRDMLKIALRNAAHIGYTVGRLGGSEVELDGVMARIQGGNTNALNEWVSSHLQPQVR